MVALVDIDDTLAPAQKHILKYVNSRAPSPFAHKNITWEFREKKVPDYDEYVQEYLNQPELVGECEPYIDALSSLEKLALDGYQIHIASSRKENLHAVTQQWLQKHGFLDHVQKVHPRSSDVKGADFKRKVVEENNVVVAFDDTHSVVEELAQIKNVRVYLIDKPWNRKAFKPGMGEIVRVNSFAAGVKHLLSS